MPKGMGLLINNGGGAVDVEEKFQSLYYDLVREVMPGHLCEDCLVKLIKEVECGRHKGSDEEGKDTEGY